MTVRRQFDDAASIREGCAFAAKFLLPQPSSECTDVTGL
jgi:hypothetical protein